MANHSLGAEIEKHLGSDNIFSSIKGLEEIECFEKYRKNPESGIDTNALVKYVILLYAKDSPLSKPPVQQLQDRKLTAAKRGGLDAHNEFIKKSVLERGSDKVVTLIVEYLKSQSLPEWTERAVIEAQIEESQQIRLRAFDSDKDKDLISAFEKKAALTKHAYDWGKMLKELDKEIFRDHDDIKEAKVKKRISLESLAQ